MRRMLAAIIAVLLLAPHLTAGDVHDWQNVQNLRNGTPILIAFWGGKRLTGNLLKVSDAGLEFVPFRRAHGRTIEPQQVDRADIQRLARIREIVLPDAESWILAGTVGGGAAGAIAGGAYDATHHSPTPHGLTWGFSGAVIGFLGSVVVLAGVGVVRASPAIVHHTKIVYEGIAPRPTSPK